MRAQDNIRKNRPKMFYMSMVSVNVKGKKKNLRGYNDKSHCRLS